MIVVFPDHTHLLFFMPTIQLFLVQMQSFNFNLGGQRIDICTDFKYLGVIFSRNRHFHQTKKHNVEHARKAMYVLFKRIVILIFQLICSCIYLYMLF